MKISFKTALCISIGICFILFSSINMLSLQHAIDHYDATLKETQHNKVTAIAQRMSEQATQLQQTTINLSYPREIIQSVEAADNEILFDWSYSFSQSVDSIIFTDSQGIVLARAPEEFHFGDSLANEEFASLTMQQGSYLGLTRIAGELSLVASRTIRKYNDLTIGMVAVVRKITPQMLQHYVGDENTIIIASDLTQHIQSSHADKPVLWSEPLFQGALPFDNADIFRVNTLTDNNLGELMKLKSRLYRNAFLSGVAMLLVLILILYWQFSPFKRLLNNILAYVDGSIDLPLLRTRLMQQPKRPTREIISITDALIKMTDTLTDSFKRIEDLNAKLTALANRDPLTGLLNRRGIAQFMEHELARAHRYHNPLSVILGDIDYFKTINDSYGHHKGDTVLQKVAEILTANSRAADIVCRWGGEEFLILCPENNLEQSNMIAEKIRCCIEQYNFGISDQLTCSFGISEFTAPEKLEQFIARADKALYLAKGAGRNCVRTLKI